MKWNWTVGNLPKAHFVVYHQVMTRSFIASFCAWVGMSAGIFGQSLLVQDGLSGELYEVSPKTGEMQLIAAPGAWLEIWLGMSMDSTGTIYTVSYNLQTPGFSKLHTFDTVTGHLAQVAVIDQEGLSSIEFGPNDTLFATVNLDYSMAPSVAYSLFSVDAVTGVTQEIGFIGDLRHITAMAFDGVDMYVWDAWKGLHVIDLVTAQPTDVNSGFLGSLDLSKSMAFSDDGVLYLFDFALYVTEPTTGVSSYLGSSFSGVSGGMEFLPGPTQSIALWLTNQVGLSSELVCRGVPPSAQVAFFASKVGTGNYTIPAGRPCAGTILDLHAGSIRFLGIDAADATGEARLGPVVLPAGALQSVMFQALDLQTCETSNRMTPIF